MVKTWCPVLLFKPYMDSFLHQGQKIEMMYSYLIAQTFVVTLPMSSESSFGRIYTHEDGYVEDKHMYYCHMKN